VPLDYFQGGDALPIQMFFVEGDGRAALDGVGVGALAHAVNFDLDCC